MVIIVNKDFSISQIFPSDIYQGSNLANELAIFAPFSVSSFPTILVNVQLPSGEYLQPFLAFLGAQQPDGFGGWTALIPAEVTALPGTVKLSLAFYGSGYTLDTSGDEPTVTGDGVVMTTGEAEITVRRTVPTLLPETPTQSVYDQILQAITDLSARKPNWNDTDPTSVDYIAGKPPIKPINDGADAEITGDLQIDGALTVGENAEPVVTPSYIDGYIDVYVDGKLNGKLDKAQTNELSAYTVNGETQSTLPIIPAGSASNIDRTAIPAYNPGGYLSANTPSSGKSKNLANTEFVLNNTASPLIGEASGLIVAIRDGAGNRGDGYHISTNPQRAQIFKYGLNILDTYNATKASSSSPGTITGYSDGRIVWSAGSSGAIAIPVTIPPGTTFTYSFDWSSESNPLGYIRFVGSGGIGDVIASRNGLSKSTITTSPSDKTIVKMILYKSSPNDVLTEDVEITNACLSVGTDAIYESFVTPQIISLSNGETEQEGAFFRGTFYPVQSDTNLAEITITYTRDLTQAIHSLTERILALETIATT